MAYRDNQGPLVCPATADTNAPTLTDGSRTTLSVATADAGLRVHITNGGSGGTAAADETAFVEGTTAFTGAGAVFNDGLAAVASGITAWLRMTALRALHINLRNNSGTEIGTLANPVRNQQVGTNPVQVQDGSGNAVTSTGSALDVNVKTSASPKSATASAPAQTATGVDAVILASNANRKKFIVQNTGTVTVKLGYGAAATATAYTVALAAATSADDASGGTWQDDTYTGAIHAFSGSAGTVVITELT